jgi:transcriptional regulator with XRE-family HTH domain
METDRRRRAFATRLNAALQASGKDGLSDGDLVKLLARNGVAVTTQTVSNWRNAKHMPKLEQIEGLAGMLVIPPGELAFGTPRIAESKTTYRDAGERQLVEAFALLGEDERALVRELMRVLTNRAMQQGKRPGPRKRR